MSLEPTLAEVIRTAIESRLTEVHTGIPGRIVSYDSTTQTADVEIVVKRAETSSSGATTHEDYPVLPNVPVAWPRGGGYSMQFPLKVGDHVYILFSEAATAQWRVSGEVSNPGDLQRHSLSYAIAIPCIAPDADPLPAATGALVTTPSGGGLSVSEAGGDPGPVAMASKVEAEFSEIATLLGGIPLTYVPNPLGVGSSNLKAE